MVSAADVPRLAYGYVAAIHRVQNLGEYTVEARSGAHHVAGAINRYAAETSRTLLGKDAVAGLSGDRAGAADRDLAAAVLIALMLLAAPMTVPFAVMETSPVPPLLITSMASPVMPVTVEPAPTVTVTSPVPPLF